MRSCFFLPRSKDRESSPPYLSLLGEYRDSGKDACIPSSFTLFLLLVPLLPDQLTQPRTQRKSITFKKTYERWVSSGAMHFIRLAFGTFRIQSWLYSFLSSLTSICLGLSVCLSLTLEFMGWKVILNVDSGTPHWCFVFQFHSIHPNQKPYFSLSRQFDSPSPLPWYPQGIFHCTSFLWQIFCGQKYPAFIPRLPSPSTLKVRMRDNFSILSSLSRNFLSLTRGRVLGDSCEMWCVARLKSKQGTVEKGDQNWTHAHWREKGKWEIKLDRKLNTNTRHSNQNQLPPFCLSNSVHH